MLDTELSEAAHGHAVFLVEPGKFEPELTLRGSDSNEAAGEEDAQGGVPVGGEAAELSLQLTQLFESAA